MRKWKLNLGGLRSEGPNPNMVGSDKGQPGLQAVWGKNKKNGATM